MLSITCVNINWPFITFLFNLNLFPILTKTKEKFKILKEYQI